MTDANFKIGKEHLNYNVVLQKLEEALQAMQTEDDSTPKDAAQRGLTYLNRGVLSASNTNHARSSKIALMREDNLGPVIIHNIPDSGAYFDTDSNRINMSGERIVSTTESIVSAFDEAQYDATHYLWGLLRPSKLSRLVHGLNYEALKSTESIKRYIEQRKEHFGLYDNYIIREARFVDDERIYLAIDNNGVTMGVVIGYPTKQTEYQVNDDVIPHDERFGNVFSPAIDPVQGNASQEAFRDIFLEYLSREQIRRMSQKTHSFGHKVIVDFIGWLSPDVLTEENYRYFKHVPPEQIDARSSDIDIIQHYAERENQHGVVLHLENGQKVFVYCRGVDGFQSQDQLIPNLSSAGPDGKNFWYGYYSNYLKYCIDEFDVDGFRIDLAHELQSHGSFDVLHNVCFDAISYAESKGKRMYFVLETYDEYRDFFRAWNNSNGSEAGYYAFKVYDNLVMRNIVDETARGKHWLIGTLNWWINEIDGFMTDVPYLSNFDEKRWHDLLKNPQDRKEFTELFLLLAKAGYNVLFHLPDLLEIDNMIPVVGGERNKNGVYVSHKHANQDELNLRDAFSYDQLMRKSHAYTFMKQIPNIQDVRIDNGMVRFRFADGTKREFNVGAMIHHVSESEQVEVAKPFVPGALYSFLLKDVPVHLESGVTLSPLHVEKLTEILEKVREKYWTIFAEFKRKEGYLLVTQDTELDDISNGIIRVPYELLNNALTDIEAAEFIEKMVLAYGLWYESDSMRDVARKSAEGFTDEIVQLIDHYSQAVGEGDVTLFLNTIKSRLAELNGESKLVTYIEELFWRWTRDLISLNDTKGNLLHLSKTYGMHSWTYNYLNMNSRRPEAIPKVALSLACRELYATLRGSDEESIAYLFFQLSQDELDLLWSVLREPFAFLKHRTDHLGFEDAVYEKVNTALDSVVFREENRSMYEMAQARTYVQNHDVAFTIFVAEDLFESREYSLVEKIIEVEKNNGLTINVITERAEMEKADLVLDYKGDRKYRVQNVKNRFLFSQGNIDTFIVETLFFHEFLIYHIYELRRKADAQSPDLSKYDHNWLEQTAQGFQLNPILTASFGSDIAAEFKEHIYAQAA